MKFGLRQSAIATTVAVAVAASSQIASAETIQLTAASSHPPIILWVAAIKDHVVANANDRLAEAGVDLEIEWTEEYGGTLYNFQDTLEAVEDGITDIGWVGTLWEGAKMPLQNITYMTPFTSDDTPAILAIFNDLHDEIPALRDTWVEQNQVLLGTSGIETYHIFTKEPIEKFEDINGLKFMVGGIVGNWLRGTGAVGIDGGLPIFQNNIQTGVADGAVIGFSGGYPFKLHEVAPYVTKVRLGSQFTGGLTMNKDTWDSLPPEAQEVFMELGREYSQIHAENLENLAKVFEQKVVEEGGTVNEFPDEERAKWAAALPNLGQEWRDQAAERGLPGEEILNAYFERIQAAGSEPLRDWTQ